MSKDPTIDERPAHWPPANPDDPFQPDPAGPIEPPVMPEPEPAPDSPPQPNEPERAPDSPPDADPSGPAETPLF